MSDSRVIPCPACDGGLEKIQGNCSNCNSTGVVPAAGRGRPRSVTGSPKAPPKRPGPMTADEYLMASARTEYAPCFVRVAALQAKTYGWSREDIDDIDGRLSALNHASLGMNTEQAEFADALKKRLIYGKSLDRTNMLEELGDLLWYVALALRALSSNFSEVFDMNIRKLQKRFPDKFTEERALERDLDAERAELEADARNRDE